MRSRRLMAGKPIGGLGALIGLLLLLAFAGSAQASTYGVHQCNPGNGVVDAGLDGSAGYTASNGCGLGGGSSYLQVAATVGTSPGAYKQWSIDAPAGTRFNRVVGQYSLSNVSGNNGHAPYLYYRPTSGGQQTIGVYSAGSSAGQLDSQLSGWGSFTSVGIGVACARSAGQGNCTNPPGGIFSRLGDLALYMQDTVAPDAPGLSGPAVGGGWLNGSKQVDFSLHDTGAGISVSTTQVNGTYVDIDGFCTPAVDSGGVPTRLQPCNANGNAASTLDLASSPFVQGDNTVSVCGYEYGDNPQAGCNSATMKVDTIAPTAPLNLTVSGAEGWKRDNDFDLSWTNPAQANAPIAEADVRITGPGNFDQTYYYPGADRNSIDNIQVPAKGDYTAQVFLKDAAGNFTPANSSSVHLKFDNTVPEPQQPNRANGWISRSDLAAGYSQGWAAVPDQLIPLSGIAGYRVVVNTNSDTDPCSGPGDPRACAAPISEAGIDNRSRTLHTGDLAEGANYVHVVPISGSGMRATDVKHTPLKADFTDPVTQLQGDGAGTWINHDANLSAVATDALSGMADTDEFPLDDPPATFLQIDGQTFSADAASVSQALSGEGPHEVKFWARDLAGNTGAPQTKVVRIDKTAPSVAFTNTQDPDDPDKLVAPASDALSGVIDGRISYRQDGGDQWKSLDTAVRDGNLVARVDSGDLKPGTTYEFRAQASDIAGNTATSTSKQNGEPMTVTGPFRTITSVADLKINGKAKAKVKYGKKPKVTGELVAENGQGVANASVDLVSSYYGGSKKSTDTVTVTTDGKGAFSASLPKGPGREIVADYKGDRRYLGVRSAAARANVRSKVTLKVPSSVDSDGGIAFTGAVKAKGAKLGKKGKRLEIQVLNGKKWKTVGKSFRASRKGKYKLSYEFSQNYTSPIDYTFRAVVTKERGFPYLPSKSKKRTVTVTP